ncbi:MAG: cytochrome c-type biogenesis protein CcmH [Vicinamibacterales bacterium]
MSVSSVARNTPHQRAYRVAARRHRSFRELSSRCSRCVLAAAERRSARGEFDRQAMRRLRILGGMTMRLLARPATCALVVVLTLLSSETGGAAQPGEVVRIDHEANEFIHGLMSPHCPGLLLSDCRSEGALLLRAEITERLAAGETRDAIEIDLVARFGPSIRTVPGLEGLGLVAWVGPGVLGVVGLALAVLAIRRLTGSAMTGRPPGSDAESATPDRVLDERLQDELAALD